MLMMLTMRTFCALADVDLGLARAADARDGALWALAFLDLGLARAADADDARDAHSLGPS